MSDICGDNRFEIIAEAKSDLLEATNIKDSPEEMAVLDSFLFRCWQMGWLRKYELNEFEWCTDCKEYDQEKHCCHRWTKVIRQTVEEMKNRWKWTPVTEALPWNDTNVLVTVRDDSGDTPWEYTSVGWRTPDGQYWVVDNEICYGVIAWMPLPEPWRGDR